MERQHASIAAAVLAAGLFACGALGGCAGPSTRVLPRDVATGHPYEIPEENQVLEEVNPFYLQESLDYLTTLTRVSGSPGEGAAADYIGRLLLDYGYETEVRRFSAADTADGSFVEGKNVVGRKVPEYPNGDILIIAASHDSLPKSPGANSNASGVAALLECARLLSGLTTDTEIRFISFSGSAEGFLGSDDYAQTLTVAEGNRVIGVIQLDTLGYVADSRITLGTADGKETLIGDMLRKSYKEMPGLTTGWQYKRQDYGNHLPFVRKGIPAVMVSQMQRAYEAGTPQDRANTVNVELLAGVVDIVSHTAADAMSSDTPSQLAKSRFMNEMQDGTWVQHRDVRFPFGASYRQAGGDMGAEGMLISSVVDGAGRQVDTYQYRMKWFDVDQIILTNYHYSNGKLETISLDADGAGVEFAEMKERISSWYGEPVGESSGPAGTEYDWADPLYHKSIALIPASDGFEVEIRDYTPEKTVLGTYQPDGSPIGQGRADPRIPKLLDLVSNIFPGNEDTGWPYQVAVFTDGVGDMFCYLEMPEPETEETEEAGNAADGAGERRSVLWIDLEDALSESGEWRNRTATVRMLTKYCGQLLELYEVEGYRAAYQEQFAEEAAGDFAEDFTSFVLFQKPAEIRDASDERILFFYQFADLAKMRAWIRRNLNMGDEMPAQISN